MRIRSKGSRADASTAAAPFETKDDGMALLPQDQCHYLLVDRIVFRHQYEKRLARIRWGRTGRPDACLLPLPDDFQDGLEEICASYRFQDVV